MIVQKQISNSQFEEQLAEDISEFYDDPLGYAMYAFDWGKGDLEGFDGPDTWQMAQMERVRDRIQTEPEEYVIKEAIASGHGIGKTAQVAMIILWAMSTRPHLNGVVTANTTTQLTTKTWRELALWHKRAINAHWFRWAATSFKHVDHPETWFVQAIPNSEHNSEAFAGLHAKHVLLIMDEGSGIPNSIKEVAMGAMTTERAQWYVFGNPTRNTGWFRECFHSEAHIWTHVQIDSRTCMMTNKKEINEWVEIYGEDSDFVRVRVRGVFPRAGNMQFISSDVVDRAMKMDFPYEAYFEMPVVMGVDVARYGDDKSVITLRAGRKLLEQRKYRELSTMETARRAIDAIKEFAPAVIFVDGVGIGAGVVDRLRMLGHDVVDVNAGSRPDDDENYYNKRIEMWDRMKQWLNSGCDIPNDPDMRASLIGIEYGYSDSRGTGELMRLERKQDMKKRGLSSPDEGDSLALTFAEHLGDLQRKSFEPDEDRMFEPD